MDFNGDMRVCEFSVCHRLSYMVDVYRNMRVCDFSACHSLSYMKKYSFLRG